MQATPTQNFDFEFLKVASSYTDLMSDDLFDKIHDIVLLQIIHLKDDTSEDIGMSLKCLQILSNLLEYIDYDITLNNMTGSWKRTDANNTD